MVAHLHCGDGRFVGLAAVVLKDALPKGKRLCFRDSESSSYGQEESKKSFHSLEMISACRNAFDSEFVQRDLVADKIQRSSLGNTLGGRGLSGFLHTAGFVTVDFSKIRSGAALADELSLSNKVLNILVVVLAHVLDHFCVDHGLHVKFHRPSFRKHFGVINGDVNI